MTSVGTLMDSEYELSTFASTPAMSTRSDGSHLTVLGQSEPQEGVNIQELAPIDHGLGAWLFCICGFIAEMFIWGFLFR